MFKILMIIFLIGFMLVSLLGFSVIRSFKQFFFGSPKSKNQRRSASQNRQSSSTKSSANRQSANRKKKIAANEGEYVDYVEIKD